MYKSFLLLNLIPTSLLLQLAQAGLLSDLTNLVSTPGPGQIPGQMPSDMHGQRQQFVDSVDNNDQQMGPGGQQSLVQSETVDPSTLPDWFLHYHSVSDMDLFCQNNSTLSKNWLTIQEKFNYILSHPDAAFTFVDRDNGINPVLLSIMSEDMPVVTGLNMVTNEKQYGNVMDFDFCGVGKLMIQMLSILQADTGDGKSISNMLMAERMVSPLMTLLLDIPWMGYQPQWPLFGMMAQMSIIMGAENGNNAKLDGLDSEELMQFAQAMNVAIVSGNLPALKSLATSFLEAGPEAAAHAPLGFLTCLFARAATAEVPMPPTSMEGEATMPAVVPLDPAYAQEEARQMFHEAQQVLRKLLKDGGELGVTLGTKWPLWGMAYLASLKATV